jgi:hypothetical protein
MNFKRLAISALLILTIGLSIGYTLRSHSDPIRVSTVQQIVPDGGAHITLKAPVNAKIGQLVVLDVSESVASTFKWELRSKNTNFLVIDNGKRAVFTAEVGGEYLFVVAAAKGDTIDVVIHTIKVAGGPAQPTEDVAAKVAQWCAKIDYAQKRDDLLKLAQSFSSVSAIISDQMTPADIVDATKKSNRDALGTNIQNWVPFLEGLQAELKALSESGKLPDSASHQKMWRAIADGLKEYAATL